MAYCDTVTLYCKNKLCDKECTKGRTNGKIRDLICPHCGFKTLDPLPINKIIRDMNKLDQPGDWGTSTVLPGGD